MKFGHGNGHIEMISESGTKFIATPEEPTGDYPKLRKRNDANSEADDNNNSKDSDNTSSDYTDRNDGSGSDSNETDHSRITCDCNGEGFKDLDTNTVYNLTSSATEEKDER